MTFVQKENCVKAVLVINMPTSCEDCPCYDQEVGTCRASDTWKTNIRNNCPLKPLPEKMEVKVEKIEDIMHTELQTMDIFSNKIMAEVKFETDKLIALGYNACIDEIVGGE